MRLADDFLFISHDKNKSIEFLRIMAVGHPEFGCFINESKTVTNFDVLLSNGQPAQQCEGNGMCFY